MYIPGKIKLIQHSLTSGLSDKDLCEGRRHVFKGVGVVGKPYDVKRLERR